MCADPILPSLLKSVNPYLNYLLKKTTGSSCLDPERLPVRARSFGTGLLQPFLRPLRQRVGSSGRSFDPNATYVTVQSVSAAGSSGSQLVGRMPFATNIFWLVPAPWREATGCSSHQ